MAINEKLKKAREHLGKNQKEMAALIGGGYRSWQGYEQGTSVPGGKVFEALAKLGFNTNWFFMDSVPMLQGTENQDAPVFIEQVLVDVIVAVETYFTQEKRYLPPEKKAQLISALYEMFSQSGEKKVNRAVVIRLAKLAS
jgi:transcriptional regulator with XRE-family HTH domain